MRLLERLDGGDFEVADVVAPRPHRKIRLLAFPLGARRHPDYLHHALIGALGVGAQVPDCDRPLAGVLEPAMLVSHGYDEGVGEVVVVWLPPPIGDTSGFIFCQVGFEKRCLLLGVLLLCLLFGGRGRLLFGCGLEAASSSFAS